MSLPSFTRLVRFIAKNESSGILIGEPVSGSADVGTNSMPERKPATSLNDPFPSPVPLPKISQSTDSADYEAELAVVIGRTCRNVTETEANDYVLGYTACNDVSSRAPQFRDSQWSFSKGFDGACPLGTVILTGTPAGVGYGRSPRQTLKAGDEFAVEILPFIGTLTNIVENSA
uniref:Fumarylacetoacetase-like C-terminal domain-containing protein n=1 Tax=Fusarium oxysporum (strain Fo5176) TaxID=660025 RepID=A0A0D2Y1E1_FUSOF